MAAVKKFPTYFEGGLVKKFPTGPVFEESPLNVICRMPCKNCFCKECRVAFKDQVPSEGMKICRKCWRELPLKEFAKHSVSKDGLRSWCRECSTAYMKGYRSGRGPFQSPPLEKDCAAEELGVKSSLIVDLDV